MVPIELGRNIFAPMPVTLVGAQIKGKPNFMTVGWLTRVNASPPLIAVALNNSHLTPKGVIENETFSICFPDVSMKQVVDYCGIVSGDKVDKSALFDLFYGETLTAPMIVDCPLNIECKLVQTFDLPDHSIYIGEIVAAYSEEQFLTDGMPDFKKIDPMLLTMPDNRYWRIGEQVGDAWKDGLQLKEKQTS